jgi:curved DNA-binding protein CbpA
MKMGGSDPTEPKTSDYYADLGVPQQASVRDIKLAFFKLAKKHHPDKKAPGESTDAEDFRKASLPKAIYVENFELITYSSTQIREAYECLSDQVKRVAYDALYFDIKDQWNSYHKWNKTQRKKEEQKRVEKEQCAAKERAEREKRAAEAEKARRMKEDKRAARERAESQRIREERVRQAEEQSQKAAQRAREQHERAAKERLRRDKEREAEERSEAAATKRRIEQERVAQERLTAILIEEQQDAIHRNWQKLREAADRREDKPAPRRSSGCSHSRLHWRRKNSGGACVFCKETRRVFFYHCPECNVSACSACKHKYCGY